MTPYYIERLARLGMTAENTVVPMRMHSNDFTSRPVPLVSHDSNDNIEFRYCDVDGEAMTYDKGGKTMGTGDKPYKVIRLKNPTNGKKYQNPVGTPSRAFLTPRILYAARIAMACDAQGIPREGLKTLFVVEGQMKALAAAFYGAHIVGISGINNYRNGKAIKGELYALIELLKPARICLLFDADAREVKRESVEANKNLTDRLNQFYRAVCAFREVAQAITVGDYSPEVYYAQVAHGSASKGVDDLLEATYYEDRPEDTAAERMLLIQDLIALNPASDDFEVKNVTAEGVTALKKLFYLATVHDFYAAYEKVILKSEFIWNGGVYKVDEDGVLEQIKHPDSFSYIRVGPEYYRIVIGKDAYGTATRDLKPWKISTISKDYGKDFLNQVRKYDGFVNIPYSPKDKYKGEIIEEYNDVIFRFFNVYTPLPYNPVDTGGWETIETFLRHIFDEQYELGLDWIQLLYTQPTQKLPIPCLVSNERGTGKSTFLQLMCMILGDNAVEIGNEDFESGFNSHFVGKLFVGIDEGFIEKKQIMESIKSMLTKKKIGYHSKGKDKNYIDCILHFALTSNNVDNFLNIDREEDRFWVRYVKRLTHRNPDMLDMMKEEIPAFLGFLMKRKMHHPKQSRFWFDISDYRTDALQHVMEESVSSVEKELAEMTYDLCLSRGATTHYLDLENISQLLKPYGSKNYGGGYLRKILTKIFGKAEMCRRNLPTLWTTNEETGVGAADTNSIKSAVGRWYCFDAEKILPASQFAQLKNVIDGKAHATSDNAKTAPAVQSDLFNPEIDTLAPVPF